MPRSARPITEYPKSGTLSVVHWPQGAPPAVADVLPGAWSVSTCQRRLLVRADGRVPSSSASATAGAAAADVETAADAAAYALLLEIVTGLRSAVVGETNVSGQLRTSWLAFQAAAAGADAPPEARRAASELGPWVEALYADAAVIRRRHLEGLGGSSYGTLARKLIAARRDERVLIVGAGDLARSVLPAFARHATGVYARASSFDGVPDTVARFGRGDEQAAAAWADRVIFCTPVDAAFERPWIAMARGADERRVLHLGARQGELEHWPRACTPLSLDELFELSHALGALRATRIEEARAACRTLADARFGAACVPRSLTPNAACG